MDKISTCFKLNNIYVPGASRLPLSLSPIDNSAIDVRLFKDFASLTDGFVAGRDDGNEVADEYSRRCGGAWAVGDHDWWAQGEVAQECHPREAY
jgi:hypothetical protein